MNRRDKVNVEEGFITDQMVEKEETPKESNTVNGVRTGNNKSLNEEVLEE